LGKDKLITVISVTQQMSKTKNILNSQVIPREELFQVGKKEGRLSPELQCALKVNDSIFDAAKEGKKVTFSSERINLLT